MTPWRLAPPFFDLGIKWRSKFFKKWRYYRTNTKWRTGMLFREKTEITKRKEICRWRRKKYRGLWLSEAVTTYFQIEKCLRFEEYCCPHLQGKKTEAADSLETLAPLYQTWRRIVEHTNLHIHHCDNLKSYIRKSSSSALWSSTLWE